MNLIDDQLTNPLVGFYIGFTGLLLVNILVALLASTVTRVYEQAVAYNVYLRAKEILNKEKAWSYEERAYHIKYIRNAACNPYFTTKYNYNKTHNYIADLQNELKMQKYNLKNMESILEQTVNFFFFDFSSPKKCFFLFKKDNLNSQTLKISKEIAQLKNLISTNKI